VVRSSAIALKVTIGANGPIQRDRAESDHSGRRNGDPGRRH